MKSSADVSTVRERPTVVRRVIEVTSAHVRDRYDRAYYLQDCGGYAEFELFRGRKIEDRRLLAVHALTAARSGDRVLDIACGRGELTRAFADDGAGVTAIDYSPDALELARETAGASGVRFVCADVTSFDDPAGYDVAVASDVIEHLSPAEVDRLYGNVARMLRPAGSLVVHTWPNAWMYRYGYPRRRAEAAARGTALPENPRTPYERIMHINEQSPNRLRRQLRAHFPHVMVWLGTADDPRGSLARDFTREDARTESDIFSYASHRPIEREALLSRITTERFEAADDTVQITDAAAPARVSAGRAFVASATLSNQSSVALSSFMPYPIRFGYLWFDESGASVSGGQGRSLIAPAARPDERRRYSVRVAAPDRSGRLTLRLTVVQEFVRWFSTCAEVVVDVVDQPCSENEPGYPQP
jgi:2-polyprenyl-3-methyl-5-hydroxy-6-metoxy-1,4-benzoquinol methylase